MNRTELINNISVETGATKKMAKAMLESFETNVLTALGNKEKVQLLGFGTFETVERGERMRRNPSTGEEKLCPAHLAPKFKFADGVKKSFKE